jgi:hypothetical protein
MRFVLAMIILTVLTVGWVFASEKGSDYGAVDRLALDLAILPDVTVNSAVRSMSPVCCNDTERARAAYAFTASYLLYSPEAAVSKPLDPDVPLKKIFDGKGRCGEYARLFNLIALRLGLESVSIVGVAKGNGYQVGDSPSQYGHVWNAVKIAGKWKLLDCAWGSLRSTLPTGRSGPGVQHAINDDYFFVAPERLIYTHFPQDPKWQISSKPVTASEFARMPVLLPDFFTNGIVLSNTVYGVLRQVDGAVLECTVPDAVHVFARLFDLKGLPLPPSTVLAQREDDHFVVRAAAPAGVSYLKLFVLGDESELDSGHCVAEFRIDNNDRSSEPDVFPQTFAGFERGAASVASPITGTLLAGTLQEFRLNVPRAESVAVLQGNRWSMLKRSASDFTGSVKLRAGEVRVAARYPREKGFNTLLKYQVADKQPSQVASAKVGVLREVFR